ncbi:hypothetical protein M422DRAFT_782855 [Sphaerobolus stellatus SS14]|uniref:F-box domain-containing protein n=1 Tax=Sphaerobolus stellatus (strain SS14) TaxID=990650 RepID=A0A0C9VB61_SPHS4|nr:hypothetical protein M422DRAFT_782855 [Sphaerobolus stellatus SS14]
MDNVNVIQFQPESKESEDINPCNVESDILQDMQQRIFCHSSIDYQDSLDEVVIDCEDGIFNIGPAIEESEQQIYNLRSRREDLQRMQYNAFNLLTSIGRMPQEIMTEIFYQAVHISDMSVAGFFRRTQKPRGTAKQLSVLLQVCHLWRHIILQAGKLFSQILSNSDEPGPYMVARFLQYSGKCPLEIYLNPCWRWDGELGKLALDMLKDNLDRMTTLAIPTVPLVLRRLFPPGTVTRLPNLRRLFLEEQNWVDYREMGKIVAPGLTDLVIFGLSDMIPWRAFLVVGDQLKKYSEASSLCPENFLHSLIYNPKLETCEIYSYEEDDPYQPRTPNFSDTVRLLKPINLLNLTSFTLLHRSHFTQYLPLILPKLYTPALKSLRFQDTYRNRQANLIPQIKLWLKTSNVALEELHLIIIPWGDARPQIRDLLQILPTVQSLTLTNPFLQFPPDFISYSAAGFLALLNRESNPDICPQLKTLRLSCTVDFEEIMDVLKSRTQPRWLPDQPNSAFMEEFTIINMDWEYWLDNNGELFPKNPETGSVPLHLRERLKTLKQHYLSFQLNIIEHRGLYPPD